MSNFICIKCHEAATQSTMREKGTNCDPHIWVQSEEVVSVYRTQKTQEDEAYTKFQQMHNRGFEQITKTIDGLFGAGKWVVLLIGVFLAMAGLFGLNSFFELNRLTTKAGEAKVAAENARRDFEETDKQLKEYKDFIDSKLKDNESVLRNSQQWLNSFSQVQSVLNNIWAQGLAKDVLENYGMGKTEFELLRNEIDYSRERIIALHNSLESQGDCDPSKTQSSNAKCARIDRLAWSILIQEYAGALESIYRRDTTSQGYFGGAGLACFENLNCKGDHKKADIPIEVRHAFADIHVKIASIYLDKRVGNLNGAKAALDAAEKAFSLQPGGLGSPSSEFYLYRALYAITLGDSVRITQPDHAANHYTKALTDLESAVGSLHKELSDKSFASNVYPMAQVLYYQGFTRYRLAVLRQNKRKDKDGEDVVYRNAVKEAIGFFEEASGRSNPHADAANAMAYLIASSDEDTLKVLGKSPAEAIALIARAVENGPTDTPRRASFRHTKGEVLQKIGFRKRAVAEVAEAANLFPRDQYRKDHFLFAVNAIELINPLAPERACRIEIPPVSPMAKSALIWRDLAFFLKSAAEPDRWPFGSNPQMTNMDDVHKARKKLEGYIGFDAKGVTVPADADYQLQRCMRVAALHALGRAFDTSNGSELGHLDLLNLLSKTLLFDYEYLQANGPQPIRWDELDPSFAGRVDKFIRTQPAARPWDGQQTPTLEWPLVASAAIGAEIQTRIGNCDLIWDGNKNRNDIEVLHNNSIWAKIRLLDAQTDGNDEEERRRQSAQLLAEMEEAAGGRIFINGEVNVEAGILFDTLAEVYWLADDFSRSIQYRKRARHISRILLKERGEAVCRDIEKLKRQSKVGGQDWLDATDALVKIKWREIGYFQCKQERFKTNKVPQYSLSECVDCLSHRGVIAPSQCGEGDPEKYCLAFDTD